MTHARWNRIQDIFYIAVDLSGKERAQYLDRECGDDPELRKQVESLVESSNAESRIGSAIAEGVAGAFEIHPGDRLDSWEIVRLLGRGGMGAVYHAVRADDAFRRDVAIKLIRGGFAGEEMLAAFDPERQILANLDHPNIARLMDGGTTPAGYPYVVMEFVEGIPIDEYCTQHSLSVRGRLVLFRKLCEALIYAHRNLVVHRDIKPANILVTSDGTPKLLDFGIAKALGTAESQGLTRGLDRVLTPEYASPEQVRGETITTATDVYLLGVLLYQLLTGELPFNLTGASASQVEFTICEREPSRPSETAPPLRRELRGDIDNIVLFALRKEPVRRYASVEQFSDDIRRHLEAFPVRAHGEKWSYNAAKFVRRHRWGVAAAGAVLVIIIAFAAGMAVLARRVANERDIARTEQSRAEQVTQFLIDSFKLADKSGEQGRTVTAQEVLDRGAARISTELKDQPAVQARMMSTMGRVYESLGLYDRAESLLTTSLSTRQHLFGPMSADTADSLAALGQLAESRGNYSGSETFYTRELASREKLYGSGSAQAAETQARLGSIEGLLDHSAEAESLLLKSLATRESLFGRESIEAADTQGRLGEFYSGKQQFPKAEAAFRQTLSIRKRLQGTDNRDVAAAVSRLAELHSGMGRLSEAETELQQALLIHRKLYGDNHIVVAEDLDALGTLRFNAGDFKGAADSYRESLQIGRTALGPENPVVAQTTVGLANALARMGDLSGAEKLFHEAIASYTKLLGPDHVQTASARHGLANLLLQKGDYAGAEEIEQELADSELRHPTSGAARGYYLIALSGIQRARGNYRAADTNDRETVEMFRRVYGPDHSSYGRALSTLGTNLISMGRYREAKPVIRESLNIFQRMPKPIPLDQSFPQLAMAQLLLQEGKPVEAAKYASQSWEIRRKIMPVTDRRAATAESVLGGALAASRQYQDAEPLLIESHAALEPYKIDKSLAPELRRLADLYAVWNRP